MRNYKTTISALAGNVFLLINYYFGEIIPVPIAVGIVTLAVALFTKDYDTTGVGKDAEKLKTDIDYLVDPPRHRDDI